MPEFLKNVFLLSAVASVTFGVIGSFVVARRIGYLAGAISHCAFGGVGFGLWTKQVLAAGTFGTLAIAELFTTKERGAEICASLSKCVDPIPAAMLFAALAALLVDWIRRRAKEREETLLSAVWAIGMAVGLIFLAKVDGYVAVGTYLFGDILLVTMSDVVLALTLGVVILAVVFINFKKLEAVCFDEEYAALRGINVGRQNRLLLVLTAITIVLMLRVIGMAMVVALLTLPAAAAGRVTNKLGTMILVAIAVCFFGSWAGIFISYLFNLATGPSIILIIALTYAVTLLCNRK